MIACKTCTHRRPTEATGKTIDSGQQLQIESALDHPADRNDGDRGRSAEHHRASIERAITDSVSKREVERHYRELPELDSHVEPDERKEQGLAREPEIEQH